MSLQDCFGALLMMIVIHSSVAVTGEDFGLVAERHRCVPITMPLCQKIGYNATVFPNLVGIENQRDAEEQLATYQPLINIQCSSQLQFFLCSVYAPMCTEKIEKKIGPCRPLCESVRTRCEPMLQQFGFQWPPLLDCEQFPGANDDINMCMKGPTENSGGGGAGSPVHESPVQKVVPEHRQPVVPENTGPAFPYPQPAPGPDKSSEPGGFPVLTGGHVGHIALCPLSAGRLIYINSTSRCAPRCGSQVAFTDGERDVALRWLGSLAGICLLLCVSALLAVIISSSTGNGGGRSGPSRGRPQHTFAYPERPVLFMTGCYAMVCVGILIRILTGYEDAACTEYGGSTLVLIVHGLQSLPCTFVFLFTYYFGLAAGAWWLVLCATWALSVGLELSGDALSRKSLAYHIPAWVVPALLTIVVLVRQTVEADSLTGLCSVGAWSTEELMKFAILPHMVILVVGMAALTAGFISALCCCNGCNPWGWPMPDKTAAASNTHGSDLTHNVNGPLIPPGNYPVGGMTSTPNGGPQYGLRPPSSANNQSIGFNTSSNPSSGAGLTSTSPTFPTTTQGQQNPLSRQSQYPPTPYSGHNSTSNLLSLGLLAFFYLVPATCLLASQFYEWSHRRYWYFLSPSVPTSGSGTHAQFQDILARYDSMLSAQYKQVHGAASQSQLLASYGLDSHRELMEQFSTASGGALLPSLQPPSFQTFILKIVASLIFGILAALWLIGGMILRSWEHRFSASAANKVPQSTQPAAAVPVFHGTNNSLDPSSTGFYSSSKPLLQPPQHQQMFSQQFQQQQQQHQQYLQQQQQQQPQYNNSNYFSMPTRDCGSQNYNPVPLPIPSQQISNNFNASNLFPPNNTGGLAPQQRYTPPGASYQPILDATGPVESLNAVYIQEQQLQQQATTLI